MKMKTKLPVITRKKQGKGFHEEDVWDIGLDALIDDFCEAIKHRLYEKFTEGYEGWDTEPVYDLVSRLRDKADNEDFILDDSTLIDIAAFAAMIWNRKDE
jgi:hypothetical protein